MAPPPTLQELIEIVRQDSGSDQPLDQLVAAAAAAAQLEETTDALLGHFVDRCRRDGRSWTEISAALGVTKQAVHKRFAPALAAHIVAATRHPTFERFTDRARHVVAASVQVARSSGADEVAPGHLLLGLFAEPNGIASKVLAAMDLTEDKVRAALSARQGQVQQDHSGGRDQTDAAAGARSADAEDAETDESRPKFSDDGKRVLRDALAVALEFGHNYIGTEHLLLGLYRNPDSTAARILNEAGVLEPTVRAHVADMLRGYGQGS
jgi:ATP-dependent Clp protease ATP-binding subunit ClpA